MNKLPHGVRLATIALLTLALGWLPSSPLLSWEEPPGPERFKPRWQVGQTWLVETRTRQSQARRAVDSSRAPRAVRWQFRVEKVESLEGRDCFVVEVRCQERGRQPTTTLWVDRQTMTLRRVRSQLPAADGWRSIDEAYRTATGQPFPAFGPLSVPPLELPVFLPGTKGQTASFQYQSSTSPAGAKALGEIDFAVAVEQTMSLAQDDQVPSLLPERYSKSLERKPTLRVELKSPTRLVHQFWQTGLPWPVFTENGVVQSALVSSQPPPADAPPDDDVPADGSSDRGSEMGGSMR